MNVDHAVTSEVMRKIITQCILNAKASTDVDTQYKHVSVYKTTKKFVRQILKC